MKIKGVTEEQIKTCAVELGMHFNVTGRVGNYVQGVLRMTGPWKGKRDDPRPYWKHGYCRAVFGKGPRYAHGAVCFHGHRDFMRAIYKLNPDAIIRTKLAAYIGSEGFERTFPPLGQKNIGSAYYPIIHEEACDCSAVDVQRHPRVTILKHSDLKRCPFVILSPEHYRPDGTCKCNDPEHRKMMKREWGYTDTSFRKAGLI